MSQCSGGNEPVFRGTEPGFMGNRAGVQGEQSQCSGGTEPVFRYAKIFYKFQVLLSQRAPFHSQRLKHMYIKISRLF